MELASITKVVTERVAYWECRCGEQNSTILSDTGTALACCRFCDLAHEVAPDRYFTEDTINA